MSTTETAAGDVARIWWIGGSKGGVGKSMMTVATVDYFLEAGQPITLVECDTSNPDVGKTYKELVQVMELIDLDEKDGWLQLVNVCGAHPENIVIINTAARSNVAVRQYGELLDESLGELGKMVALWLINRQRDSVELLREFMDAITHAEIHVVRNGYFGGETQFELYNTSKMRSVIESRGGKSVTLPDLADRVTDDLYSQRLPISAAAKTLPIGNRAELTRWRREVRKVMHALVA